MEPMFILLEDNNIINFENPTDMLAAFYATDGHYAQAVMIFQDPNTGFWRSNPIARKGMWYEETTSSFILPYGENEGTWVYTQDIDYNGISLAIIVNINENGDIISVLDVPDINEDDTFIISRRYFDGKIDNRIEVASATSLEKAISTANISVKVEGPNDFVSYIIAIDGCVIAHVRG